jgi:peptidoglycan-N-acetylglucosamine deacetylase
MAGTSRPNRPRGRMRPLKTGICLALISMIPSTVAVAQAGQTGDESPRGEAPARNASPVKKAQLSQAGRSLIFQLRTDRQIALSGLERQPDLNRPRATYLCFEMVRGGTRLISRLCIGGKKNQHHRIGITRTNRAGKVFSKDTIPATLKRSGKRKIVFKIDPETARLKPATYTWRVVESDGECETGESDCRTAFPARHSARYRVKPVEIIGCTGGNGQFVTHGPRNRKRIALTFDDGPGPYSDDVLSILKRHGVKSTFFQIGQEVERYPSDARRILAEGHELANHSTHHGAYPGASDIGNTNSIIERTTGFRPCLFRPPGGAVNSSVLSAAAQSKVKVVNWDIDTNDWRLPGSGSILAQIKRAKSGSIVLMHDGGGPRGQTVGALEAGIENLQGRGYELVTVTELLGNEFRYRPKG